MVETLENEIWLPVKGYEKGYMVSNLGRVKAMAKEWISGARFKIIRRKQECLITQHPDKRKGKGYLRVALCQNGKVRLISVHRLVLNNFLDNNENKPSINHKNGIKTDNRVENLEWVTHSENLIHSYQTGLSVSKKRSEHSQAVKVKCDTLDLSFDCMRDAADALDVHWYGIWNVCSGRKVHIKGLSFRYL